MVDDRLRCMAGADQMLRRCHFRDRQVQAPSAVNDVSQLGAAFWLPGSGDDTIAIGVGRLQATASALRVGSKRSK